MKNAFFKEILALVEIFIAVLLKKFTHHYIWFCF